MRRILSIALIMLVFCSAMGQEFRCAVTVNPQKLLTTTQAYESAGDKKIFDNMKQALEESLVFWQNIYTEDDIIVREVRSMLKEMEETNSRDIDVLRAFALRSGLPDIMDFVNIY